MSAVESFALGFAVTAAIDMAIELQAGRGDEPAPLRWLLQGLVCLAVVAIAGTDVSAHLQWPFK